MGKTTCAAATVVHLAKLKRDKRILLITTDPARALNRMLDIPLTDQPTLIEGFSNLWAQEIDAKKANEAYREEHWTQLAEITYRSSLIYDAEDSVNLTRLEAPGVDEVIALKKIVEFRKSQEYDLVVVDTAPTGHTLTLLRIMGKGEKRADKWIDTQYRHRMVRAAIRMGHRRHFGFKRGFVDRCYLKDDVDEFLDEQKKDARLVKDTLTDRQKTEFICITIPEAMGILETYDLIEGLKGLNVRNNKVIVNRVNLQTSKLNCSFCHARGEREAKYIDELKERLPHHKLIKMPLFPYEIRGLNRVEEFGDILFGKPYE
ncbi:MAG: ArsA family ATPase, partial [Candidatus Bathyarchaeota archaeon]|nr:ArsA family ATPase [Candidatus Bathyarchaeota archaeon]